MSTETANVVSLPISDDDQKHEKIVKEEDHAAEKCDTLPSANDAENHEKGNRQVEISEGTEATVTNSEETQVINHAEPPVVLVVEKADHVVVQNAEADHECQPLELGENVPQTTESEVENEAEKTEPIEDVREENKVLVEEVAIEAVENEPETTQASEACEKKEAENITIENESERQATEECEDKEIEAIAIEAAEKELAKAGEEKQEETAVIEEQKEEKAKDVAVENVEIEKKTSTDQEKTDACELATNTEAQTAENEASLVDNVEEDTMRYEKPADKEEESSKEASLKLEAEKSADSTNELQNAADQVKDRDLVAGSVKEDEYKDIKEAKGDSETDVAPSLEPCKDGEAETETEASKDQVVDVSAKPTQKQSGNGIISKVKQSFVKVKKAIGKSLSSKVLSPEIKADQENVK